MADIKLPQGMRFFKTAKEIINAYWHQVEEYELLMSRTPVDSVYYEQIAREVQEIIRQLNHELVLQLLTVDSPNERIIYQLNGNRPQ